MKFKIERRIAKLLLFLIVLTIFSSTAYAYHYVCLNYGEAYPTGRLCERGCCRYCANENNGPTNPNYCYGVPSCSCGGGNFSDLEAPNITINSPVDENAYFSRSVLIDIDLSETSYLYFQEEGRERYGWMRLCPGKCSSYSRERSFDEGKHALTIRATDLRGNEAKKNITFYIDSIAPRIRTTYPKKGEYGNGEFTIEYSELNVVNITLYYKENGLDYFKNKTKEDCPSGGKEECTIEVAELAQGPLTYYFSLTDKAQTVYSDEVSVEIDTIPPELTVTNPHNPLLIYNNGNVLMEMSVNEEVVIEYIDYSDRRPRWRRLCRNCMGHSKIKSFGDGYHNITIKAIDKAGNEDIYSVGFMIDSKKPRIRKTEPTRGYTDGNFYIEFSEENPEQLVLNYGDSFIDAKVDIGNDCYYEKKKYYCNINVSLEEYDGGTIEYWFDLTDIADNSAESRHRKLKVDTTFPVINNPYSFCTVDGRYVYFYINITEENLDSVEYIDNTDSRKRWKRLCSRLKNGVCKIKKAFRKGEHDLSIQVTDKAGNAVGESINFVTYY